MEILAIPLALSMSAFILLSWEATRRHRKPLLAVAAVVLLGTGVAGRIASAPGVLSGATLVFSDLGLGLLAGATVLLVNRGAPRPFFLLAVLALAASVALRVVSPPPPSAESDTVTILVELGPDDVVSEIETTLARYGARAEKAFPSVGLHEDADLAQVMLVSVSGGSTRDLEALINELRSDAENVDHVELNSIVRLPDPPAAGSPRTLQSEVITNDPLANRQWALEAIRGHEAHTVLRQLKPERKAIVAILDTGVDSRHEDVRGVFSSSPGLDDAHGHGTHCAGIAGAATNNALGMASLNWEGRFVEITSYRALSSSGMGTIESIAQAIIDATSDGADVLSLSLGDYAPKPPKVVSDAVAFALRRDAIVVAAAGNAAQDAANHMPANIAGVIAVAAVDQELRKARFSNTNTSLERPLAAPGVDILSLVPDGSYGPKSGTSMATPLVAGLLGVLRALDPSLEAERAYEILSSTGTDTPDASSVGPMIDAASAIGMVAGR
jgi:thermitase